MGMVILILSALKLKLKVRDPFTVRLLSFYLFTFLPRLRAFDFILSVDTDINVYLSL